MSGKTTLTKEQVEKYQAKDFISEIQNAVRQLDVARQGSNNSLPVEVSLSEFITERYGLSREDYMSKIGLSTKVSTMANVFSMPDSNIHWLIPEIIREAITLGLTQAPFYPNIIAGDQPINGLQATMPMINPSDANPAKVNEGETIPLGTVSFGQKTVNLYKIGKGFKITDEVRNYVSLDVLSIFLRDFGTQVGYSMDTLAMDVLINGNKPDGSESAPVLGVKTQNSLVYRDLLKLWVRAARLGRNFNTLIGGEDMAVDMLDLPEFKDRHLGTTQATLNLKSPVPNSADFYIHPGVDADQVLLLDPRAALIKLTAKQLMLESERIASNQTQAIYATLTTGFSKMYMDAAVLLDKSVAFTSYPSILDVDPYLNIGIE